MSRSAKCKRDLQEERHLDQGFYAKDFQPFEVQDLEAMLETGLSNEIAMLRVITRRVFSMAKGIDDFDEATVALRALGMASNRVASLLKTQAELGIKHGDDLLSTISSALEEVAQELRLKV